MKANYENLMLIMKISINRIRPSNEAFYQHVGKAFKQ